MSIVSKLLVLIGADTSELSSALQDVSKKMRSVGRALESAGGAMVRGITMPLAAVAGVAGKFSGQFDKAMSQSLAIMSGVSADMRREMETVARTVSEELPISSAKAAEGFYYLASAGMSAAQAMRALPQVARFAIAGQFDLARATEMAAQAQSALELKSDDAGENLRQLTRVTDVLTKANVLAQASTEQFAVALTNKAAGAIRQVGMTLEEGVAVLAAFAEKGVQAEEGGTALYQVIRDLQKAAQSAPEQFKRLGVAVFESNGEFRRMADVLMDLQTALGSMSDSDRRATLSLLDFQEKSLAAIQTLLGSSVSIRKFSSALLDAGGTARNVADNQVKNLVDQLAILRNTIVNVGIDMGHALAPAFEVLFAVGSELVTMARGLAKAFEGMPRPLVAIAAAFGTVVASIGPFLFVMGFVIRNIGESIKAFTGLRKSLVFLSNPLGVALTALALMGTAVVAFTAHTAGAAEKTQKFADNLEQLRYDAENAKKALDELHTDEVQKEQELLALMKRHREFLERELLPFQRAQGPDWKKVYGGELLAQMEQNFVTAIHKISKEIDDLRNKQADLGVSTKQLAIVQADYNREMEISASKYAVEKDDLARINRELSAKQRYYDDLIRLGGDTTIVQALWEEIQALQKSRDELLKKGAALVDTTEKAKDLKTELKDLTPDEKAMQSFQEWGESLSLTIADVYQGIMTLSNSIAQGLGNAFAQAIVWGQSWSEAMVTFVKNVAAAMISFIVEVLVQQLLAFVLTQIGLVAAAGAKIGAEIAYGSVAAAASAFAAVPFPFNFAAAVAAGAAAESMLTGLAASGFAAGRVSASSGIALAEGGLVRQPTLALVGEAGPELVTPLDRLPKFHPLGGGDTIANLYMDGQFFARAIIPKLPRMVRRRIGRR